MFNEKNTFTYGQLKKLRSEHTKVSPEVFIQLSETEKELTFRKELVKQYGNHCNVSFFSDGSVHMKSDGKEANSWILAPHPYNSSDCWRPRKKVKEKTYYRPSGWTPPF